MLNSYFSTVTDSPKILQIHSLTYGFKGGINLLVMLFSLHLKQKKNPLRMFPAFPGASVLWCAGIQEAEAGTATAESPTWMTVRTERHMVHHCYRHNQHKGT